MRLDLRDLFPVTEKIMTAEEYLNLTEEDRSEITEIRTIPPKIGSRDFVQFRVTTKSPIFQTRVQRKSG